MPPESVPVVMLSAFSVELLCKAESAVVPWAAVAYALAAVVATVPRPNVVLAVAASTSSTKVPPKVEIAVDATASVIP